MHRTYNEWIDEAKISLLEGAIGVVSEKRAPSKRWASAASAQPPNIFLIDVEPSNKRSTV